ncbi:hypothetical protein AMIS_42910 [Actinoplanes missouriensis 431]|uniref:Uncharacterized protein n=1 Tax=Actinoplanes missouriensis (strain ATCC 14538 / DSM 43046 / CBS 188.64 / JCM 3121 / NBRC 102363 / NCIMB 12654 / NRRL B-3342 / UNCC 431) TaxID=512565 RepID=I0H924_ACTM4|nr:beta-L-arabinofuranosidase domain-containing protein [Actinoplanes missouriensis]BAL89511.1 hypothetical protein AMIS_42910 [Actinoplanes missouriensis 431]
MSSLPLSRRSVLRAAGAGAVVSAVGVSIAATTAEADAAVVPPVRTDIGNAASEFMPGQVRLTASRLLDNQNRTMNYLRFVDVNRMLYVFRANHRLSTAGAAANGGWDAPNFPFRSHMQGHFLTAWAQAYAYTGDTTCRDKADYMVAELAKCQANNAVAGFNAGYLSGFPESDLDAVESGKPIAVSYYCIHKTLAGLLDVWRLIGNTQAKDVLLKLAGWVDWRTGRLSYSQMQTTLQTEFGGMNEVLANLYQQTGDARWLRVAQRFDHAAIFDPLAANRDELNGKHANTNIPKWVGAIREFKATGTTRYRDIAGNAWNITVGAHTYAIGGNSQAEHFKAPNAIAGYLTNDTCEQCNTYNMLKLTRELWQLDPNRAGYFDFYENALYNHLIGAQNPADSHGHITYFTPLKAGGRRGVGPAWGGGTWSTDYNSFWCCQGTGIETNTKLMDSIYFRGGTTLTVNLYVPSTLNWSERGLTVTQTTAYPVGDTSTFTLSGSVSGSWGIRFRIPAWAAGATIAVNGANQNITVTPGSYATVTRTWADGDTITVRLPMRVIIKAANDNADIQAITYGPSVLAGNYGNTALSALPSLTVSSIARSSTTSLAFTATANGARVNLGPFWDAQGFNYTVYWNAGGSPQQPTGTVKLVNVGSNLVLGIQDMSTADGGLALQWGDTGTADHNWTMVTSGNNVKFRNANSQKVLGVENMGTGDGARVLQWGDTGTADHLWTLVNNGDGTYKIRNVHSGKLLAIQNNSTAQGALAVQDSDNGGADNRWRIVNN